MTLVEVRRFNLVLAGKEPTRYLYFFFKQQKWGGGDIMSQDTSHRNFNTFTNENFICQYKTRDVKMASGVIAKGP